ncbi:methylcrotonoyl-CoA carboxylase subunit alpha, mitochondrial isoform X2 [Diachasmimorpha longicaudata]|uniref:methylcrotonoyl-CoA carboxylase subunit alpha, mitochondrial isoform X2 n=1 Tax=Diachasmimorpha longicaudata TaxID=58733 RepID=UPI0030B8B9A0
MMFHQLGKGLAKRYHFSPLSERGFATQLPFNKRINKVLIANRGEIACRIQRTAKKLGVKTVAVYSDADANSMHVDFADEAYHIGPPASTQSYLRQDKIINVAKKAKCQAIHPGYGFLSENMEFADLCRKENIIFIGPPATAIRDMGIKSTSKDIMSRAGVPIITGYHSSDQSNGTLLSEAEKIGFPLMIKAVRGGGGKGMRIASNKEGFMEALESARTESQKAFGDSDVLLEKYVQNPRHVEVQIFADQHGNAVYLFERDCSVQRRHQKVIEEAPAPGLSDKVRREIGEAAVRAAKAVGYVGAGTVEFIYDRNDQSFYFMEMNTRLQVEHPVTEAITGLDLVEWQLNIAAGEKLPLTQDQISINGHAFEARIYAEIAGVETNVEFVKDVSRHSKFQAGDVHTGFIDENLDSLFPKLKPPSAVLAQGVLGLILIEDMAALKAALNTKDPFNPFKTELGMRINHSLTKRFKLNFMEEDFVVDVKYEQPDIYLMRVNDLGPWRKVEGTLTQEKDDLVLRSVVEEMKNKSCLCRFDDELHVFTNDRAWKFIIPKPDYIKQLSNASNDSIGAAVSPMPGVVDKILVSQGDIVSKGDPLVVIVAMKMEHVIRAPSSGAVEEILCSVGSTVGKDRLLLRISNIESENSESD